MPVSPLYHARISSNLHHARVNDFQVKRIAHAAGAGLKPAYTDRAQVRGCGTIRI